MSNFTVLTWNLAQGGPSINAPASVDQETNLFAMLDLIEYYDPDFICLQEMPSPGFVNYLSNEYVSGQAVPSHSGNTAVFVRKGKIAELPIQLESQLNLPPAAGISLQLGEHFLIIFSIHLVPSKEKAATRAGFLKNLVKQLSPVQPLIFAGDSNMREAETDEILQLGLKDAYKQIDDPNREKYATWDSFENKYNISNFKFKARFDRMFYRNLKLEDFQLIGNKPQSDPPYYLSDHFGILATFSFED